MSSKLEVALVKEACPICGKAEDGPILMNTRLTEREAQKVKELHGQVIGYMDKPCSECQGLMEKGFLLIGVIEEKTEDRANPYRSGNQWVITMEAAKRMFKEESLSRGAAFIDMKVAVEIGLTSAEANEKL